MPHLCFITYNSCFYAQGLVSENGSSKNTRTIHYSRLPAVSESLAFAPLLARGVFGPPWTTTEAPADLIRNVDFHTQLLGKAPYKRRILLEHPTHNDKVKAFLK